MTEPHDWPQIQDESPATNDDPWPDDRLDAEHVCRVAAERRSLARSRSHAMIAAGLLGVGGLHLLWLTTRAIAASRPSPGKLLALAAAGGMLVGACVFWRKSRQLASQMRRRDAQPPLGTPEFGPLSDGSQRVRALDDLIRR